MAKDIKVSVVIITYNQPDRIGGAIQTVLDQTFQDFEIIIVDGANSPENKMNVLKFKDKRIKYIRVESEFVNANSQIGMQHARNVGCKESKGKYIAMLDDDDRWMPTKLEKQVKIMEEESKVGLVLCYMKVGTGNDAVISKNLLEPTYKDLLMGFNMSSTSSLLIRTKVLKEIGGWNEKLRGMHEHDIALKIAKKGYLIKTVPEPLMHRLTISMHHVVYKINEAFDLWHYYGRDFIPLLGIKGFIFKFIKTSLVVGLLMCGYIVKNRVWKVIYPLDMFYRRKVNV